MCTVGSALLFSNLERRANMRRRVMVRSTFRLPRIKGFLAVGVRFIRR